MREQLDAARAIVRSLKGPRAEAEAQLRHARARAQPSARGGNCWVFLLMLREASGFRV